MTSSLRFTFSLDMIYGEVIAYVKLSCQIFPVLAVNNRHCKSDFNNVRVIALIALEFDCLLWHVRDL